MSAEQAKGGAEAFGGAASELLATKSALRMQIADLRMELREEIAAVRADLLVLKWMSGFTLALVVAVFGKVFLH